MSRGGLLMVAGEASGDLHGARLLVRGDRVDQPESPGALPGVHERRGLALPLEHLRLLRERRAQERRDLEPGSVVAAPPVPDAHHPQRRSTSSFRNSN